MKALALVALSLLLAGCTSGSEPATPEQDEQGRYVIHMTSSNRFTPAEAKVPAGATVVWVNDGGVHDVTSTQGTFSSPRSMAPGTQFTYTFNEEGKFPYQCDLHASQGMKGTIHVGAHDDHE